MRVQKHSQNRVGDDDAEVTPVPMPNTEVKLCSADDTWREAARESRKSPAKMKEEGHCDCGVLFSWVWVCKNVLRLYNKCWGKQ